MRSGSFVFSVSFSLAFKTAQSYTFQKIPFQNVKSPAYNLKENIQMCGSSASDFGTDSNLVSKEFSKLGENNAASFKSIRKPGSCTL
ncbi:hypothetical protein LEP1GSC193_3033 [Leptospira alstonii serovar Pingchang str. 80-412]|uniref:Uncharacterized protein n=1 Tax=Leptospira alstonii serovar Pingchang str. 80-412 TaxID=1218564 RepID=T0FPL9_9LEPT|nr:hypothetical protein LEP1GSC193_3033 [Leptospira alstonii serovar Pingchang str. 80-412]